MRTQQTIDAVIKAHGVDRGLYLAVLDPEGGKAGHAGQARGRLVRVVQVPQVADIQPGAQLLEDVSLFQRPCRHCQRARCFVFRRAVDLKAILGGTARTHQLLLGLAVLDQRQVLTRVAFAGKGRAQGLADLLVKRHQRAQLGIPCVELLQRAGFAGQGLGRKTAPAQHAHHFFQRSRGQVGAVFTGRQGVQRAIQKTQLLAGQLHAPGETLAVPVGPGVAGLDRLPVAVEQAPVEVETIGLMPAKSAFGAGVAVADRAAGIKPDQIDTFGCTADFLQNPGRVRQGLALLGMAVPRLRVEQQVRVDGQ